MSAKKMLFKKEDWILIQPQDIFKQTDGNNCGVIAFLHLYFLLGKRKYRMSLVENFKDIRIWLASKLFLLHWNDVTLTGFRKKSVQKIFVEYDVCEGEIKND